MIARLVRREGAQAGWQVVKGLLFIGRDRYLNAGRRSDELADMRPALQSFTSAF